MSSREFRGDDSVKAELLTRNAVVPFLAARGFDVVEDCRKKAGIATQQFVAARAPDGQPLKMRVRLCWRREGRNSNGHKYAAAQLRAKLINDDWDATLQFITDRDRKHGNTHNLIVQRDGAAIVFAALIPREALRLIWQRQSEVSDELLHQGLMGRITQNHARNGNCPTIWLQDDRTANSHQVANVLWDWPGVVDLAKLPQKAQSDLDDTFDDCIIPDYSLLGSDGVSRHTVIRSECRRDPRVRLAVLQRASECERPGCGGRRDYQGFLDVHHILGVDKSDRVWNCVALCPNCHRDAHFAPNADHLNKQLLEFASRFKQEIDSPAEERT